MSSMKPFIFLVFIGAIIGLGVLAARSGGLPATSTTSTSTESASALPNSSLPSIGHTSAPISSASTSAASPSPTVGLGGQLYTLYEHDGIGEIQLIDIITKEVKTLYSDKDKDLKIQSAAALTPTGDRIFMVLGATGDLGGQLVSLKTDGSGQTTVLNKQFSSTVRPAISPDQKQVASVSFANTEQDFGFSLALSSLDGSGRKILFKDEAGISRPTFTPDGKKILYLVGSANQALNIQSVDLASGQVSTLYSATDRTIQDFSFSPNGMLVVVSASVGDRSAQATDVFITDPKNNSNLRITNDEETEHAALLAPDASGLTYIKVKTNKTQPGDIIVSAPDGTKSGSVGLATGLIGWIK